MLPVAVARAIQLAGQHPAVAAWRVAGVSADGQVAAEFDIRTELPAAWRSRGESPSGVRSLETVTFTFLPGYPVRAPHIALRGDFSRAHPHLNPGPAGWPPEPCIVAGSPRELLQARGIEGFIDQIADWLDAAAMLALNDPKHGWEPVRRDTIDDIMVVDGEGLRAMPQAEAGCAVVQTEYVVRSEAGKLVYFVDHRSCVQISMEGSRFGRGQVREGLWRGNALGLILWAGDDPSGQPIVVGEYLPETVVTVRDLRTRARLYGCADQLDAKINLFAFALQDKAFEPTPLTVTFLVRRPFHLVGSASPVELCSYLIHFQSSQDLIDEDRGLVRLCAYREELSIAVLRRATGTAAANNGLPWALIGCGSVGSKIAVHLARQGDGPALVVDQGVMMPHNFARHAMLPGEAERRGLTGAKATLLADGLEFLQQRPAEHVGDVISLSDEPAGRSLLAGDGGRVLLNTTGSTVVRESLSFLAWEHRPLLSEAHLLGAGEAAYAAFEGDGGNPNLSDLAAESYHRIAGMSDLRTRVFGAEAEAIAIGQGCGAVTFPMPDSRLSAFAAGLAGIVARSRAEGRAAPHGHLHIGEIGRDGVSQSWLDDRIEPWTVLAGKGGIGIRLSPRVTGKIVDEIAAKPGCETGGVLIGRFSQAGNAFQVVDVLKAPPDSVFSAEKFVLGTVGLKAAVAAVIRTSGGSLYPLGTWHNHLVDSGPSALDAQTAAQLALRQFFPVLMLIALPSGYTCLTAESFDAGLFDIRSPDGGGAPSAVPGSHDGSGSP